MNWSTLLHWTSPSNVKNLSTDILKMSLQTMSLTTIQCIRVQDFQTTRYTCLKRSLYKTVTITCINKGCRVLAILSGSFLLLGSFSESFITCIQEERVSNKLGRLKHLLDKFKGKPLVTDLFEYDQSNKLFILFSKLRLAYFLLN